MPDRRAAEAAHVLLGRNGNSAESQDDATLCSTLLSKRQPGIFSIRPRFTGQKEGIVKRTIFFVAALVAIAGLATTAHAKDKDSWTVHFGMSQGRLGAQVTDMTEELRDFFGAPKDAGILVSKVSKDSPAAKAGIRVGDVIVEVDGKRVDRSWDVIEATMGKNKGDKVAVVVVRKKRRVKLSATLDKSGFGSGIRIGKGGHFDLDLDDLDNFHVDIPDLDKMKGWSGSWSMGGDKKLLEELKQTRKRLRQLEKRLEKLEKK
jgi:membrane-associated protease RseP (regulator of RpoE activity)